MIRIDLSSQDTKLPASIIEVASNKTDDEHSNTESLLKSKEDELKATQQDLHQRVREMIESHIKMAQLK